MILQGKPAEAVRDYLRTKSYPHDQGSALLEQLQNERLAAIRKGGTDAIVGGIMLIVGAVVCVTVVAPYFGIRLLSPWLVMVLGGVLIRKGAGLVSKPQRVDRDISHMVPRKSPLVSPMSAMEQAGSHSVRPLVVYGILLGIVALAAGLMAYFRP